jgi:hypothetical protein
VVTSFEAAVRAIKYLNSSKSRLWRKTRPRCSNFWKSRKPALCLLQQSSRTLYAARIYAGDNAVIISAKPAENDNDKDSRCISRCFGSTPSRAAPDACANLYDVSAK